MPSALHDAARFSTYFRVHETRKAKFRDAGTVGEDTLQWTFVADWLELTGEVSCRGGIVVSVFKRMLVTASEEAPNEAPLPNGEATVKTMRYAYNAHLRDHGNIFRHDNAHPWPGHPDDHHRHRFDPWTGEELPGSPEWVGEEGWPTLGQFIEMVELWYWTNRDRLDDPDGFPELRLR